MNSYREMVLLPLEVYKRMRQSILVNNDTTPMQKELFDLKQQYKNIAPDQRMLLESDIITKHTGHIRAPSVEPEQQNESYDNTLVKSSIEGFSKSHKNRALQLYNYLETTYTNSPKWNEKGELLNDHNIPLPNTNIVDLINFVTTSKARKVHPNGMSEFIVMMDKANVPSYLFSNKGQESLESYKQSDQSQVHDISWQSIE